MDKTICLAPLNINEVEIFHLNKINSNVNGSTNNNSNNKVILTETDIAQLIRSYHMNSDEKNKIIQLVLEVPNIIKRDNKKLSSTNILKHTIRTTDENPVYSRNYRYPLAFRKDVDIERNKLWENNIIRPSNPPYNAPVWVVPKKPDASGKRKVRMVVDYRKLN